MKKFIPWAIGVIILVVLINRLTLINLHDNTRADSKDKVSKTTSDRLSPIDGEIIQKEEFKIFSFKIAPLVGRTEVFIGEAYEPAISLMGFFHNARVLDLDTNGNKIFELQLMDGGKLVHSLVYKYKDHNLIRIMLSTERPGSYIGTFSSGTEFIDVDKDGIKEMLVYHRHYPPEAKRTVEVYRFNSQSFQKYQEYEETMSNIYL